MELTTEQRKELSHLVSTGKAAARELTHARMLLKADQGLEGPAWSDSRIQEALEVRASTVQRVRKCCAQRGVLEAILPRPMQGVRRRRLDGTQEASLIALVCSPAPDGSGRWTLRGLAHHLVELATSSRSATKPCAR